MRKALSGTQDRMAGRGRVPALLVLMLCTVLVASPAVSAQTSSFSIDVWTSKGGEGYGVWGGDFDSAEDLVIYIWASHDCRAAIAIGPADGEPDVYLDAELTAGDVVSIVPKQTGVDLTGSWLVWIDAVTTTGGVLTSDYVEFTVGATPGTPAPTTAPTSQPTTSAVTSANATVLDALIALKMAEGSLPVEAAYDADANGQVTVEDARLILRWAVQ